MAGINKVILIGNLGKDPEIRTLESGTKVATFSLATSEAFRKEGSQEWQEQTEWHNIVLWRYNAEKAESSLKKGMQIYVEGKLRTRQWTDQNQNTRYTTEIIGDKVLILTRREGEGNHNNSAPFPAEHEIHGGNNTMPDPAIPPKVEDDLPF